MLTLFQSERCVFLLSFSNFYFLSSNFYFRVSIPWACQARSWRRSGKERGTDAAVEAIDEEIAAIYGEDLADAFSFRDAEESGIGEVHGTDGQGKFR